MVVNRKVAIKTRQASGPIKGSHCEYIKICDLTALEGCGDGEEDYMLHPKPYKRACPYVHTSQILHKSCTNFNCLFHLSL